MQIDIHQAKTQLSKLIDAALGGEEIIITKVGKPAIKFVSLPKTIPRQFGALKGKIKIAKDFDASFSMEN